MQDESGYFTLLEGVVASLPLEPQKVGEVLGVPLAREPESDGPAAVERWHGESADPDGPFDSVDLSLPGPFGGDASLLAIVLRSSRGVTRQQVIERLGADFNFRSPSPNYPDDAVPAYLIYHQPWGELRMGVSLDADGELREIVLQVPVQVPASAAPDA